MQPTLRRLLATATAAPSAAATGAARAHLTAGAPTGLTGLYTHPAPRTELQYLYHATLARLRALPAHSAYRRATEALTRQRLAIVEAAVPAGHAEWQARADRYLKEHPDLFTAARARRRPRTVRGPDAPSRPYARREVDGRVFVTERLVEEERDADVEWDGRDVTAPDENEGPVPLTEAQQQELAAAVGPDGALPSWEQDAVAKAWEPEPQLDAEQVAEVEQKLGAGLIEEVIQVAEGELKLVNQMIETKAWEELVEKPAPGQWKYFERSTA